MRRYHVLYFFMMFVLSGTLLFQNCSEMKGSDIGSATDPNTAAEANREVPEFLANRAIPLDNKILSGPTSFSVGGEDVFIYETDYKAVYESTLVTIRGEDGAAIIEVQTDDCTDNKTLSNAEITDFIEIIDASYTNTLEKVSQGEEETLQGCSFPRLVLDATGDNGDVEIFYSPRECTPENNLYIADIGLGGSDPEQVKNDAALFFDAYIDQLCGN